MMRYWDLPGPIVFLESVEEQLYAGASVVLAQCLQAPPSLLDALGERWRDSGWHLRFVGVDHQQPIDTLFEALRLETAPHVQRDCRLLLQHLDQTDIVVVEDVGPDDWPRWRDFAAEYERLSRNVDKYERPLLLLLTRGVPVAQLGPSAPALKIRVLDHVVSEIDMLVYADMLLRQAGLTGTRRRLAAAAIARVAAWDTRVADLLGTLPVEELFAPQQALASMAAELGWQAGDVPAWERGTLAGIDGMQHVHAALLALNDGRNELETRLWSAQAAIILPLVEQHRKAIIERIRHRLQMPRTVGGVQVTDPFDLEIAELGRAAQQARVEWAITDRIARLRYVRNRLAHLELLTPSDALDPELHMIGI